MEPNMISLYTSYKDSVSLVIKGQDIELERISTIMTTIDLSSNHFEGVIPKTLKDLSSLWLLNLSHNNLIGHIPMELRQLNKLEALDLSWNRLTGKIPKKLITMKFLAVLNLSQNLLIGSILKVYNSTHLKMTRMVETLIYVVLLYQSNVERLIHPMFLNHWNMKATSAELLDTTVCFFDFHETSEFPCLITKPETDLLVFGQEAQSESQKTVRLDIGKIISGDVEGTTRDGVGELED
uniref:Uncharacterized protein n=1 Tax=Solanum lycopersicum TaxID=4081 RepID=A0A3Q7J4T6_SOLLC